MSDCFSHDVDIGCPDCPPMGKRKQKPLLKCVETNYSGCGIDVANCPECGHGFEISYKVDKVVREEAWDGQTREEQEAEFANDKIIKEAAEHAEFERLKKKFEGTK